MADDPIVTETPHTTVIERRGSGGMIFLAVVVLLAVIVGAYFVMNSTKNDNLKTDAITSAAKDVGAGAQKVGDSAQKAADTVSNN